MTGLEIRSAAAVGLLYVVRMLGLFMVLPVLPLVADDLVGATPLLIGLALGIYGFSQACLQIPLGLLSDRIGRKPVILGGLLIFLVGSLIAAAADSITGIVIGRFLQGCGAIASTLLALVSDVTRAEHRSKAMAIVGISIAASFGLALVLGPLIASHFGLSGVFLFCAGGAVAGAVVAATMPVPAVRARNPDVQVDPHKITKLLTDAGLSRVTLGIFLLHYLLMSSFVVLPLVMQSTGQIEDADHYVYYFWLLLGSFLAVLPFVYLADRRGYAKSMILFMIGALLASMLLFSAVTSYGLVLAAIVLFFMAFNLMESVLPALVSKVAPAGQRGTAMGIFSSAQFAGGFAGGLVGGFLAGGWDLSALMYANAVICGGWFLFMLGMRGTENFSTITFKVNPSNGLSSSDAVDALLSLDGVIDVAMLEQGRLAYIKVDHTKWDAAQLERLGIGAVPKQNF